MHRIPGFTAYEYYYPNNSFFSFFFLFSIELLTKRLGKSQELIQVNPLHIEGDINAIFTEIRYRFE